MERLLFAAQFAGATVALTGDPEQLKAIEAAPVLRAIAECVGAVEITEVRRQRAHWRRAAMPNSRLDPQPRHSRCAVPRAVSFGEEPQMIALHACPARCGARRRA